jgi:hypothetical protein
MKQTIGTAAVCLRAVQREVGAAKQLIRLHAIMRSEGDADAGGNDDPVAFYVKWRRERVEQAGGE